MNMRNVLGFLILLLIALGSWYLAGPLRKPVLEQPPPTTGETGFYLKGVRIHGTDETGKRLYEIRADFAEQKADDEIAFRDVEITYTPAADVPWTLNADAATIGENEQRVVLRGHVVAESAEGPSGEATEFRTPYLVLHPHTFRAETDSPVQIRVGAVNLTATGMLALLQENRLKLKSNVNGKFVP